MRIVSPLPSRRRTPNEGTEQTGMTRDTGRSRLLRAAVLLAAGAVAASPVSVSGAAPGRAQATLACKPGQYRVRAGDTLTSIARRFHTTVAVLARANALDPDGVLLAGRVLKVPRGDCESRRAGPVAATPANRVLAASLSSALAVPGVSRSHTGVVVVDLDSSSVAFAVNAELPLEPASTEKLPVALTALQRLGAGFRTHTEVLGRGSLAGSTWRGDLVLKGYGDPTLSSEGLAALARAVRNHGISAVSGRILGDESYYDTQRTSPGWKPWFGKSESPLLSSLVVNRGALDGLATDHPALAAAVLFTRALATAGVSVAGKPDVGVAPASAVRIARRASPPLIRLLSMMDTWSDNFIAEMLLKQLGARLGNGGTTAAGAAVVRSNLAANGVPLIGVRLADASGLSSLDRLTARSLAAMLETVWHDPALRALPDTFAVAGSTGTLRHRLLGVAGHALVRGKTGTTDHSSALAGLVGSRYAFAIVNNGYPVNWTAAHMLQDRVVMTLLAAAA
jgi:D-alanyl-D-alanine carboxypeptidase/D-alanyl-D-alanine-endopeptidase (penicillin-binding protein 4)